MELYSFGEDRCIVILHKMRYRVTEDKEDGRIVVYLKNYSGTNISSTEVRMGITHCCLPSLLTVSERLYYTLGPFGLPLLHITLLSLWICTSHLNFLIRSDYFSL